MPAQPANSSPTGPTGSAQEKIHNSISQLIQNSPDRDINYLEALNRLTGDPDVNLHKVTAALLQMERKGLLVENRREKVDRPEAKDRKVIQYRATHHFKQLLGIVPPDVTPSKAQGTATDLIDNALAIASARGFVCKKDDLINLFLCLQAKPFLILSGISGTGKTQLPRIIGDALGAKSFLIPVKPNWTDNSDLMGYYSITQEDFVPGRLLQIIRKATADPTVPYFVVLDEMNLAHVEHYMSDILSVMETRRRTGNDIVTDPLPVELPPEDDSPDNTTPDEWASLRAISLPWNLFLFGTVNVDETTHPFSRKVLDRAFAIDFNDVSLLEFLSGAVEETSSMIAPQTILDRPLAVREVYNEDVPFFQGIASELVAINEKLRAAELHFAYRVRDEVSLYMWAWKRHGFSASLSRDDAFDLCILQKVLPRCQGSSEAARKALEDIFRHASTFVTAAGEPGEAATSNNPDLVSPIDPEKIREPADGLRWRYPRTARKALRMMQRYSDTGHFAFWS